MSKVATLRKRDTKNKRDMNSKGVSLLLCGYCGEPITAKPSSGKKAVEFSVDPCDKCKERMEKGIMIVETLVGESEAKYPKRTGRLIVITEESFKSLFEMEGEIAEERFFYMESPIFSEVFDDAMNQKGEVNEPDKQEKPE
jgi:hypothetical protein